MKIYLAARYTRHPEMRIVRDRLEEKGHEVVSRWINGGHELTKEGSTEAEFLERRRFANEDFRDLWSASVLVCFTEEPRSTNSRGGRHVEFGIALGMGKPCVVVGPYETVFHCLPWVERFENLDEAIQYLSGLDDTLDAREELRGA